MGDRSAKLKLGGAVLAAAAGAVLAAAVATAQGPGDYQPTSTTTTTLPGPGDGRVDFRADAKAGPLRAKIRVRVECDERCEARARGRVRLSKLSGKGPGSRSFKLGRDEASLAGGVTTLVLRVPKGARRVARAKAFDGKIRSKIKVIASDAAGNVEREQLRPRFRDPRP
jgi:hypothetical protein